MTDKAKTLPQGSGKLRNLKRTEYFTIGKMIEANARISSGVVTYHDGWSDELVAKRASESLQADITAQHVAKTRATLHGKLPTEGATLKERVSILQRQIVAQSERIRRLEDYLQREIDESDRAHSKARHIQNGNGRHS